MPRIPAVFPGPSKIQEEFPGGSNFQFFRRVWFPGVFQECRNPVYNNDSNRRIWPTGP